MPRGAKKVPKRKCQWIMSLRWLQDRDKFLRWTLNQWHHREWGAWEEDRCCNGWWWCSRMMVVGIDDWKINLVNVRLPKGVDISLRRDYISLPLYIHSALKYKKRANNSWIIEITTFHHNKKKKIVEGQNTVCSFVSNVFFCPNEWWGVINNHATTQIYTYTEVYFKLHFFSIFNYCAIVRLRIPQQPSNMSPELDR